MDAPLNSVLNSPTSGLTLTVFLSNNHDSSTYKTKTRFIENVSLPSRCILLIQNLLDVVVANFSMMKQTASSKYMRDSP
jgi:hypothetical protein